LDVWAAGGISTKRPFPSFYNSRGLERDSELGGKKDARHDDKTRRDFSTLTSLLRPNINRRETPAEKVNDLNFCKKVGEIKRVRGTSTPRSVRA